MKKRSIIATVVAIPTGLVLLASPLVACGCLEPWQELLGHLGAASPFSKETLHPGALDSAAKRKFLGQPLKKLVEIRPSESTNCASTPAFAFDCTFWISRGPIRETGFRVVATAGPKDEVKTIQVLSESRYFGTWRPQVSIPQ
jgi:hypothetical protein